jgi:hypothetical protein
MFHPLEGDLSKLSDSEVESRVMDLSKKYFAAQRLGKPELLTQLATFVTIYKEELSKRHRDRTRQELNGDLDQLINVNN